MNQNWKGECVGHYVLEESCDLLRKEIMEAGFASFLRILKSTSKANHTTLPIDNCQIYCTSNESNLGILCWKNKNRLLLELVNKHETCQDKIAEKR